MARTKAHLRVVAERFSMFRGGTIRELGLEGNLIFFLYFHHHESCNPFICCFMYRC